MCFSLQLVSEPVSIQLDKKDMGMWNIKFCFYEIANWVKRLYYSHAYWKDQTGVIRNEKIHLPAKQIQ